MKAVGACTSARRHASSLGNSKRPPTRQIKAASPTPSPPLPHPCCFSSPNQQKPSPLTSNPTSYEPATTSLALRRRKMKAGREDAAVEKDAAVEAVEKPAVVIAAAVGAAEGAVAATGGGAPSAVTAPAAVAAVEPAVGEQVEEEVAVDLEEQRLKRKREQYELIDKSYEEAHLDAQEVQDEAVEFDEEVDDELSEVLLCSVLFSYSVFGVFSLGVFS